MKVAIVYDKITKFGGAERVLMALHDIWPDAPLYTSVYNKVNTPWSHKLNIYSSFLQKIPFSLSKHELFPLLTPFAFESFDFSNFDVVISVTASDAKCLITKANTLHVCYCLTPPRYLWSGYRQYLEEPGFGILNPLIRGFERLFSTFLRQWDYLSSFRVDFFLSISDTVSKRIHTYYNRMAPVIFPPVDTTVFVPSSENKSGESFYLIVSRLVPYKKIDYAINAFNKMGKNLIIIGSGMDKKRLRKKAGDTINFVTANLTDKKLCWYYQNCKGLIFPGEEDFGLTVVEAQSCGTGVIAYRGGGSAETIIEGVTGVFFETQSEDSLIDAVKAFEKKKWNPHVCRKNATKYSKELFNVNMKEQINSMLSKWRNGK